MLRLLRSHVIVSVLLEDNLNPILQMGKPRCAEFSHASGVGLQTPGEMIVSSDRQELNNSEGCCVKKKAIPFKNVLIHLNASRGSWSV